MRPPPVEKFLPPDGVPRWHERVLRLLYAALDVHDRARAHVHERDESVEHEIAMVIEVDFHSVGRRGMRGQVLYGPV